MKYEKLFDTSIIHPSVKTWKEKGKKVIGTICSHIPEELIHAAGMIPVRIRATGCTDNSEGETWMTGQSCSYASSCLQYLIDETYGDLDGVIASDGCMMASRIFDNWKFINPNKDKQYLHHMAAPRIATDHSIDFYKEELDDVKEGLEEFSGVKITDEKLRASVEVYNESRRLIRELYELRMAEHPVISGEDTLKITLAAGSMPKEEFNELLTSFLAEAKNMAPITDYRVRLIMIGSALDDPEYVKAIEDTGALVVSDAMCFGGRYLWEPLVLEEDDDDVLKSIGKYYLERPVCPRMIDLHIHDALHDIILDMYKDYKADGVIYPKMQNCLCWGSETVHLHDVFKKNGIQMLEVEREQLMSNVGQLTVRVEAFIETIEGED